VVRHPLVARIVDAYEARNPSEGAAPPAAAKRTRRSAS
jgi:phosphate starvation-inducible protein PhoH